MPEKQIQELFSNELQILETANRNVNNNEFKGNELLGIYKDLANNYKKLLKLSNKIFNISDKQGKELKKRETEIKVLLNNSNQGFLTFGKDLLINREYSEECLRIFNKKIAGCNIIELITNDDKVMGKSISETFSKVFDAEDDSIKVSYLNNLPSMLKIENNYVSIKYKLVTHEETKNKRCSIMLILTDITEKRKVEDQVLYLSYHDKLTSLYNRAYIESVIPQLQSEVRMPLSIIMGDMNGLKLTNDVFGHESGDKLLKSAANIFQTTIRESDIAARWGGDEFLIILPNTSNAACKRVCERISERCSKAENVPIQPNVSLGYATMENANTCISELLNIAENHMYSNKLAESKKVRRKIILSIEKIMHTRCFEDINHINRLKLMASHMAVKLNISDDSVEGINLPMLAALHDIGKVAIPKELLAKPDVLTSNEWEIMKSHTEIGFRMAQSIEEPILAQAILAIRERWDGSGYPYGLKGEQIPLIARIMAIIDSYDVMTHDRPYKSAMSEEHATQELKRCSGKQFDPQLVSVFINEVKNNGFKGINF